MGDAAVLLMSRLWCLSECLRDLAQHTLYLGNLFPFWLLFWEFALQVKINVIVRMTFFKKLATLLQHTLGNSAIDYDFVHLENRFSVVSWLYKGQCPMKTYFAWKIHNNHNFLHVLFTDWKCLFTLWLCGLPLSFSGLGDFDNLHAEQLDFRLAILQHLLGSGQHLPILGNDKRNNRSIGKSAL